MFNLPNISDISISEGSPSKDLKNILNSYQEVISKLTLELDNIKRNQNNINEFNKNEHKMINTEIETIKNQLLTYQSNLGTQTSKMSILEKEVTIFRSPTVNASTPLNCDTNDPNLLPYSRPTSKFTPINKSDGDTDISDLSQCMSSFRGAVKSEENLNFLIVLKLYENTVNTAKSVTQIQEHFVNFKNEITTIFTKKDQVIENLIQINKALEDTNSQLKNKLMTYEEENNKGKFCIHCHKSFVPKFNEDKSCVYHPGKLKYYSCRGCGGDEYYTCCMKCTKCSNGCKMGKHIAV